MPYITQEDRSKIDDEIDRLIKVINTEFKGDISGVLNYTITRIIANTLKLHEAPRYHNINCAAGVLECIKLELYRRIAQHYEDSKILLNKDVREYEEFEKIAAI